MYLLINSISNNTRLPVIRFNLNILWLNFLGQNDSIFLSVQQEKKFSHFDLKSWVTGGIIILPNFLGQNDSIFCSVHREK